MNKSFTLIEILVVIVVIGIISSFIIVGLSSVSENANIAKIKVFFNSIDNSLLLARVSQWKLDEVIGSSVPYTVSDSWGINTGTLGNGTCSQGAGTCPTFTNQCVFSNCFSFDGVDDYIDCGSGTSLSITEAMTISVWVKPSTKTTEDKTIFCNGYYNVGNTGIWLYINATENYFRGVIGDGSGKINFNSLTPVPDNKWTHLLFTYNNPQAVFYINSINVGGSSLSGPIVYQNNFRRIGQRNEIGTLARYFSGLIDEFSVYNQAASISKIQEDYFLGLNKLYKDKKIEKFELNQKIENLTINE
jgi:prepilin-type N-terminal cleavage/methylation domain-containing protein